MDRQRIKTFDEWFEKVSKMEGMEREAKKSFLTIVSMICWMIWKERCNVVFKRRVPNPKGCIERIKGVVE